MNVPWQAPFCTADAAHCDAVAWLPRLVDWAEHPRPECDNRAAAVVADPDVPLPGDPDVAPPDEPVDGPPAAFEHMSISFLDCPLGQ